MKLHLSEFNFYRIIYFINYILSVLIRTIRHKKNLIFLFNRLNHVEIEHINTSYLNNEVENKFSFDGIDINCRFIKNSNDYWLINYPYQYLEEVKYEDKFDREELSNWIERNIGDLIRRKLCSQYRIEHIWIYKTLNNNGVETYNLNSTFHKDGDLPGSIKFLTYLNNVDEENGPFLYKKKNKIIKVLGNAGTTIFFKRYVEHAGSNTKKDIRFSLSCLCYPTISKDPIFLNNSVLKPFNALFTRNPFK